MFTSESPLQANCFRTVTQQKMARATCRLVVLQMRISSYLCTQLHCPSGVWNILTAGRPVLSETAELCITSTALQAHWHNRFSDTFLSNCV